MRVANSITREAVPGGLFAGKAKQLYDYLYSKTRGAVIPRMSVRLTKRELMRGADINTEVTLRSNLNRLRTIGLVETLEMRGVHGGNEYTIYIPDEILSATGSRPSRDSRASISSQKLEGLEGLETRGSRGSVNIEIEDSSPDVNTLLKTTTDDDDDRAGLLGFVTEIQKAALALVRGPLPVTEQERERWIECGKTLAEELHKIGMRTGTVSSVPALLNAHLRRCFGRQQQPPAPTKEHAGPVDSRERLKKIIRETRGLHVGDSGYQREEMIADVRYRAERAGLRVDDALIEEMVGSDPLATN